MAVTDTGWCSAQGCSQLGILSIGTKSEDAKTREAISGNAALLELSRTDLEAIRDAARRLPITHGWAATDEVAEAR